MSAPALTFILLSAACLVMPAADEAGKIVRPVDHAGLPNGPLDIAASAPAGKLELDGQSVAAQQPFPNVLHAIVNLAPGPHSLALVWEQGRQEIRFFVGPNPPAGFQVFHSHPPLAGVACTQCHELSSRGRFHFKGGCFDCHKRDTFTKAHTHNPDVLSECGLCHNAHGSTVKAHLIHSKEAACKLCHN